MRPEQTAILLIGFQNDYFAEDGILHSALEDPGRVAAVRDRTVSLLSRLEPSPVTVVSTPILFTEDYRELVDPVGILKTIKDVGAFRADRSGGETIPELRAFGGRIIEVPGKRGLNAFSNTSLMELLRELDIRDVVIAGVVTSICVDSTGRHASDVGFDVTILSDCTAGRTIYEQDFYCREIFPLYASVKSADDLLSELGAAEWPTRALQSAAT